MEISKGIFDHHFESQDVILRAMVWSVAEQRLAASIPIFERAVFVR
jgi:hypothetical protein